MIHHAVKQKKAKYKVHSESTGAKSATIFILSIHCRFQTHTKKTINAIQYVLLKYYLRKTITDKFRVGDTFPRGKVCSRDKINQDGTLYPGDKIQGGGRQDKVLLLHSYSIVFYLYSILLYFYSISFYFYAMIIHWRFMSLPCSFVSVFFSSEHCDHLTWGRGSVFIYFVCICFFILHYFPFLLVSEVSRGL